MFQEKAVESFWNPPILSNLPQGTTRRGLDFSMKMLTMFVMRKETHASSNNEKEVGSRSVVVQLLRPRGL